MPQETNNAKRGSKRYSLEFSLVGLFCWGLGLFFLLGWIFALGVLVGRGLIPEGAKVLQELRGQMARLQDMVSRKDSQELERLRGPAEEYKFAFYDELVPPADRPAKKEAPVKGEGKAQKKVNQAPAQTPADGQKKVEYTVQVASLETETEAAKIAERLRSRGYSVSDFKGHRKGEDLLPGSMWPIQESGRGGPAEIEVIPDGRG